MWIRGLLDESCSKTKQSNPYLKGILYAGICFLHTIELLMYTSVYCLSFFHTVGVKANIFPRFLSHLLVRYVPRGCLSLNKSALSASLAMHLRLTNESDVLRMLNFGCKYSRKNSTGYLDNGSRVSSAMGEVVRSSGDERNQEMVMCETEKRCKKRV